MGVIGVGVWVRGCPPTTTYHTHILLPILTRPQNHPPGRMHAYPRTPTNPPTHPRTTHPETPTPFAHPPTHSQHTRTNRAHTPTPSTPTHPPAHSPTPTPTPPLAAPTHTNHTPQTPIKLVDTKHAPPHARVIHADAPANARQSHTRTKDTAPTQTNPAHQPRSTNLRARAVSRRATPYVACFAKAHNDNRLQTYLASVGRRSSSSLSLGRAVHCTLRPVTP